MTEQQTLVEFLAARLDEDEAAATEAGADEWTDEVNVWMVVDSKGEPVAYDEGKPTEEQAAHIARHDPARVLREVESKRAILADHSNPHSAAAAEDPGLEEGTRQSRRLNGEWCVHHEDHECSTLRAMAAVYSDHPDYRPEWAGDKP